MSTAQKAKGEMKDTPPLEISRPFSIDPKTGERIQITRFTRGVMVREIFQYSDLESWLSSVQKGTARRHLEAQCEALRKYLEAKGLPTDRQRCWIQAANGSWHGLHKGERVPHSTKVSLWITRLEENAPLLTKERAAGELLWIATEMIDDRGNVKDLWHVMQYAQRFSNFQLARVNNLAFQGASARQARAAGPRARRATAGKVARVIQSCAASLWCKNPGLRGSARPTAEIIKDEVNNCLRSANLLPRGKNGLSAKTMADYISKNI